MKKYCKIILVLLILAIAVSAFAACKKTQGVTVTFVNGEEQYSAKGNVEQVKQAFDSQPVREGYVFKGWYLDKDTWQNEIASENIESVLKENSNISVYAYWVEIVNRIVVSFRNYNGAILLEREYERSDDQLQKDIKSIIPSARPDDGTYTYTFKEWSCDTSDLTQAYYLATPIYDSNLRNFDVNYYVDGKLVYTDSVRYGDDADLTLVATPQKPSTDKYDYVFTAWEGKSKNITADTDLQAKFEARIKRFDVTFNFGNGKSVTRRVAYGESAAAPGGNEIVKSSTQQNDYVFIGWDNTFNNVTQNTVVNAKYVEQVRLYDVNFWIDSTCVRTYSVPYGSQVEAPSQPIKVLDDGFTYVFLRWDVAYNNIISNLDVHAVFDKISHEYTVNYVNWDGTPLYSEKVSSGNKSTYAGETPTRDSNDKFDYIFDSWSDADKLNSITRNITVQAVFKEKKKTFTVEFLYGDGKSFTIPQVGYGTDLTQSNLVPTDVEKQSTAQYEYTFLGWDGTYDNITANTVIRANYAEHTRSYEVKFFVDGVCVKSLSVLYGEAAQAPSQPVKVKDDGYVYEFTGWDKDFDNIVGDKQVNANFDKKSQQFKVQFVNWDGEVLDTQLVDTDGAAIYAGETPTREKNDQYEYEFIGWSGEEDLNKVTKSFTVYAQYERTERTYTVTFNYGHGLKKEVKGVAYGTDMALTGDVPTLDEVEKSSTKQYDFTFIDWNKYYGYVSCDMEITAIYKDTLRRYLITFVNNGNVVKTQEVDYGKFPTAPTENIFRNDTAQWDYSLLGWAVTDNDTLDSENDFVALDPNAEMVEDAITYTAVYLRTIQRYVVKFFNEEGDSEALKEITVDYGTDVIAQGLAPTATKESSPKYHYIFSQWSKALNHIEANVEVYAKYDNELRSYKVTFMNGDGVFAEYSIYYEAASPTPDEIPTKNSTQQYDFEFLEWVGAYNCIYGDTVVNASYRNLLRFYKVTFFNLATYELISTIEMGYGSKITTAITRDGYTFDSWYKDPNCDSVFDMENDIVDGTTMLFGNTVMNGLQFNDKNEITGYTGSTQNLVIPIAANGKKVNTIKKEAFKGNTVIGSVYIPNTITSVEAYAFSGLNLTESGGIYIQSEKNWTGTPKGWNQYWNRDDLIHFNEGDRPVTYEVDGIYTVGDFQYVLISNGNYAIVDKFINNTAARAQITDTLEHKKAYFTSEKETDVKTGIVRDVYTIDYTTTTYNITRIAVSAFENSANVSKIFIPKTIEKVGNYAFSGISADVFIEREKPAIGNPSGWGGKWNDNRSGQEGTRTLYWGVIDMAGVGDYDYIFMADGTAVIVEYTGSKSVTSIDVASTVDFKDATYQVVGISGEVFANMTLLSSVTIGEGVEKIGNKIFYMDSFLSKVTLPSTLKEIGEFAFMGAMLLKEIYIPKSVKTIGQLPFIGIDNLTIYCGVEKAPTYLPGISGYNLLWNVKLGLGDIGDLTSLKGIAGTLVNPNRHPVYYNIAGLYTDRSTDSPAIATDYKYLLYNDKTAKLISSSNVGIGSTKYTIPEKITYNEEEYTVTAISAEAFAGNTRINSLIIPSSVTSIEAYAFQGCSNLTIKTAHTSKPSGWDENFNPDNKDVQYGYEVTVETSV